MISEGFFFLITRLTSNEKDFFFLPETISSTQTPTECSTIQFNSDTDYLELAQTPEAQSYKPPPLQILITSPCPPVFLTNWLSIKDSHDFLLKFDNLLEWLMELRKALYLLLPVHYKRYNSGTARCKRGIG